MKQKYIQYVIFFWLISQIAYCMDMRRILVQNTTSYPLLVVFKRLDSGFKGSNVCIWEKKFLDPNTRKHITAIKEVRDLILPNNQEKVHAADIIVKAILYQTAKAIEDEAGVEKLAIAGSIIKYYIVQPDQEFLKIYG